MIFLPYTLLFPPGEQHMEENNLQHMKYITKKLYSTFWKAKV